MKGEQGLTEWLVYMVIGLVTALTALRDKYIAGRLGKVEKQSDENEKDIRSIKQHDNQIELGIAEKFADHEKEERDRQELLAKDVTGEFKELRKDMNTGHSAILREVNALAREVRNGNGRT